MAARAGMAWLRAYLTRRWRGVAALPINTAQHRLLYRAYIFAP